MAVCSHSLLDTNRGFLASVLEWPDLRSEMTRIYESDAGQCHQLTSVTHKDDSLLSRTSVTHKDDSLLSRTSVTHKDDSLLSRTSVILKDDSLLSQVSTLHDSIFPTALHHLGTSVRVSPSSISSEFKNDSDGKYDVDPSRPLVNDGRNSALENPPDLSDFGITSPCNYSKSIPQEEKRKCKRKKTPRKMKVRMRSDKKWKTLAAEELGFHISVLPNALRHESSADGDVPLQDLQGLTSDCCLDVLTDENIHQNLDIVTMVTMQCVQRDMPTNNVVDTEINETEDDIAFFGMLGIDILNDDYESDPISDWDGVKFQQPQHSDRKSKGTGLGGNFKLHNTQSTRNCQVSDVLFLPSNAMCSVIKKWESYRLFELECSSTSKVYVRADRSRRVEKAHKAVKSKNCNSVFNNKGQKSLYMHHRLIKINNISLDFRQNARHYPMSAMTKVTIDLSVAKAVIKANRNSQRESVSQQNVKHALSEINAPRHLDTELASFLVTLQLRELTPEDYEMLLRLDESVKPKTVSKNILDSMRTEVIGIETSSEDMPPLCTVCMEPYVAGQERKFLPCNHNFHTKCIDVWLKNSSMNCPLDGLPVGPT